MRRRRRWSSVDDVADAIESGERGHRHVAGEAQLDLMVGKVAKRLHSIDLDQPALADDRDAIAGLLDLAEDVAGQEDRPALGLGLADDLVEGLLDERIETGRRLVEDQQVGSMLQRDDEPDLLLVALRVLAELAARVDVEAVHELLLVRRIDPAPQVREVVDRLAAGQLVVEGELAGQIADPTMDRDGVDGRLDPEDEGPATGRADVVEQRPDRSSSCRRHSDRGTRTPRRARWPGRRR